jgi:hypothetical protein
MNITELTPSQLRHAADLKERIEKLQTQLDQLQGSEVAQVLVLSPNQLNAK